MAHLKQDATIGLIALSNGISIQMKETLFELESVLNQMGFKVKWAPKLYQTNTVFQASDEEKAKMLMDFYQDEQIQAIFDISGGDLANGILSYLDYELIQKNHKPFFGYSDLSVVINALYAKTHQPTYLYQIRHLVGQDGMNQQQWFKETLLNEGESLFNFDYEWIQGQFMQGEVVGGNIRCFLKLAGTPYLPSFKNKILLLESYSGDVAKMATYLNQYQQMGVFDEISGLILGSFTEMEKKQYEPDIITLVQSVTQRPELPIIKTSQIGHGSNSKCVMMGKTLTLKKEG